MSDSVLADTFKDTTINAVMQGGVCKSVLAGIVNGTILEMAFPSSVGAEAWNEVPCRVFVSGRFCRKGDSRLRRRDERGVRLLAAVDAYSDSLAVGLEVMIANTRPTHPTHPPIAGVHHTSMVHNNLH